MGPLRNEDEVEKPRLDDRSYRALTLDNGMKVLLVSDMGSQNAAACLDVAVGHFSDPEHLPGLAHFCEHMLFLGTTKYPQEDSYRQYVSEHGGYSNAFTSMEDTAYHFQVIATGFREALDHFAQFFLSPLFTASATQREIEAVDSEAQRNLQSDAHRFFQLHKSMASERHPFHKFGTGNKTTLWVDPKERGIDIREELLRFYEHYYSANLMSLVLVAPESLDALESLAVELFSGVKNTQRRPPAEEYPNTQPFEPVAKIAYAVPVKDIRRVDIIWTLPPIHGLYRTKPYQYLAHLLGHEGKGSILACLKARGWATALSAGPGKSQDTFATFETKVYLTEDGENHREEILAMVFGYLRLLRESGIDAELFDECKVISEMSFEFSEREEPGRLATRLASSIRHHPPKHYLSGQFLYFEYDPVAIGEMLEILVPETVTVMMISKKFESVATEREKWFQTRFHVESVGDSLVETWSAMQPDDELCIPSRNDFIPTDFSIIRESDGSTFPKLVRDDGKWRMHHLLDNVFMLPKTNICVSLQSPSTYCSPRAHVLARLFVMLLNDELNEYAYDAEIAGLYYGINSTGYGFSLTFQGFSHKMDILVAAICRKLASFAPAADRFSVMKESLRRDYENFFMEQPYQHAMYVLSCILENPRWHIKDYVRHLDSVTLTELEQSFPTFLRHMATEVLVHGNVDQDGAAKIVGILEEQLQFEPLCSSERRRKRIAQLPKRPAGLVYRMTGPNPENSNSAALIYYEIGPVTGEGLETACTVELLSELINEPFFTQLRTNEQLGYSVSASKTMHENVIGMQFIIQGTVKAPDELDERIEAFLEQFKNQILDPMSDPEFGRYVKSLISLKREKEKQLSRLTNRFWNEILGQTYLYDRREREAEVLETVHKAQVAQLFERYLQKDGKDRRKLSIYVHGKNHPRPSSPTTPAEEVTSIEEFKETLLLHPPSGYSNFFKPLP